MKRRLDWETRLVEFIDSRVSSPFEWGSHDCALFACDAIEVMTDIDPAAWFRGRYDSAPRSFRLLRDFAGGGLRDTTDKITSRFGMTPIEPLFAAAGDLGLLVLTERETLAICCGPYWFAPGHTVLARLRLDLAMTAWRVG